MEKDNEEFVGEPNEFLESEEHSDTHLEHSTKINAGEQDADIYTEEGREELEEADEIEPWEEGFSEGAEGSETAVCAHCGAPLGDREEGVIEKEISGDHLLFCSDKCASAGKKN